MLDATKLNASRPKKAKEILTPSQRVGEFVALTAMLLFFAFFVYHQADNTGFFTAAFGLQAMFLLYGPLILSMAAPVARAISGRRNSARPLEIITNVFLAMAALWFLVVFPFDFTHLADALPTGLRFFLAWVNDDIGRIVLMLQLIVCPLVAIVTTWQYFAHRRRAM